MTVEKGENINVVFRVFKAKLQQKCLGIKSLEEFMVDL